MWLRTISCNTAEQAWTKNTSKNNCSDRTTMTECVNERVHEKMQKRFEAPSFSAHYL